MSRWTLLMWVMVLWCAATSGSAGAPRPKPAFVYVHENALERRVWGFTLDLAGKLTPLPKSPFAVPGAGFTGGGPTGTAAYSASKKTLYLSGAGGVSSLKVAKNGQLKSVAGSPFGAASLLGITSVDVGKQTFVYAADPENDRLLAFTAAANGKLKTVPGSPFPTGDRPVTVTASGTLLFAVGANDRTVTSYRVGSNGALTPTPGSPFVLQESTLPFGIAAAPGGASVYIADCLGASQIFGYSTNGVTGALTGIPGSPVPAATSDVCAGVTLAGTSLLYAFQFDGTGYKDIQAFRRESNGALTSLGALQSSNSGVDLAASHPAGTFLVTARSQGTQGLRAFSLAPSTGVLTPSGSQSPSWSTVDGLVVVQP